MRILWLSHFVPFPPTGGARQRTHHLLRQAAARHEVHVLALNQRANLPTDAAARAAADALAPLLASIRTFPIPADASRWRRLVMTAAGYLQPAPYDVCWLRSAPLDAALRALGADAADRFDLVHVDTIGLMPYVRHLPGVPVALNHHNVESQLTARRAEKEKSRAKAHYLRRDAAKLARAERALCPAVGVNMVVSALDGGRLAELAPGARTVVVDNGVDVDYFRPDPAVAAEPGHLVFAGGMNWFPNREAMRWFVGEIWPALLADDPSRRATIIGRDAPADVRAAADARLAVPGFVDDVRPFVHRAGIYVCPIRNGGGTRLKILDALALAKPLVATALAVEGLALEPEVHYLRAETPADYVVQVRRLERDPALRRRLAEAGRRLVVERYSWSVIGRALDHAYDVATGRGAVAPRPLAVATGAA